MKDTNPIRSSICKAAKNVAQAVGAKAIIVESATGRVARAMVHYRPDCPVIAVATSQLVCRKLCLNWGVMAVMGGKGTQHRRCQKRRHGCCAFVKQNLPDFKHRFT